MVRSLMRLEEVRMLRRRYMDGVMGPSLRDTPSRQELSPQYPFKYHDIDHKPPSSTQTPT